MIYINFSSIFFLRWSGIRDDLLFLLDEELSNVSLCALHSEMRNTEQLLGSLGLFSYRCNALEECNEAISHYGPELSRGYDRIKVKLRKGQQTAVTKNNISVASFSGKQMLLTVIKGQCKDRVYFLINIITCLFFDNFIIFLQEIQSEAFLRILMSLLKSLYQGIRL